MGGAKSDTSSSPPINTHRKSKTHRSSPTHRSSLTPAGACIQLASGRVERELILSPGFSASLIHRGRAGARNNKEESDSGGLENRYKMVFLVYLFSKDNA